MRRDRYCVPKIPGRDYNLLFGSKDYTLKGLGGQAGGGYTWPVWLGGTLEGVLGDKLRLITNSVPLVKTNRNEHPVKGWIITLIGDLFW